MDIILAIDWFERVCLRFGVKSVRSKVRNHLFQFGLQFSSFSLFDGRGWGRESHSCLTTSPLAEVSIFQCLPEVSIFQYLPEVSIFQYLCCSQNFCPS